MRLAAPRGDAGLDIAFTAPLPGVVALFGPSGAGKSSILAAIAGTWRPAASRIAFGDDILQDEKRFVRPERRRLGVVSQEPRLFPHLSVAGNLDYGARRARGARMIDRAQVVALLGLAHLLRRRPATLSGGERHRVAIGRALLAQPRALLMDEPLAALDAPRKAEILACLARLRSAFDLPILYVTHSLDEVASLADTLVLIERGRVLACGPAEQVAGDAHLPLAARRDAASLLAGRVTGHDDQRGLTGMRAGAADLLLPRIDIAPGAALRVRIQAREVILAAAAPGAISLHNVLASRVASIVAAPPAEAIVALDLGGGATLLSRVTADAVRNLSLAPGGPVLALVKSTSIEIVQRMEAA